MNGAITTCLRTVLISVIIYKPTIKSTFVLVQKSIQISIYMFLHFNSPSKVIFLVRFVCYLSFCQKDTEKLLSRFS